MCPAGINDGWNAVAVLVILIVDDSGAGFRWNRWIVKG